MKLASCPRQPLLFRHARVVCTSASSGSFNAFQRKAQRKASEWAAQQGLEEKARDAQQVLEKNAKEAARVAESTFRNTVDTSQSSARRTFTRLDNEYQVQDKAASANRKVRETFRDVDQQYGIRRKFKNFAEYMGRTTPVWRKRAGEFLSTPIGKATAFLTVACLIQLPAFWRVVNTMLLMWWACIPISLISIGLAQRGAAQRVAAAQQTESQRAANPFADILSGRGRNQGKSGSQGKGGSKRSSEGPIIDADFTIIDPK
eukprot:gene22157-29221_t